MNNESNQMQGAGMAMIHHRNLAVSKYVKQLNTEKRIAKTSKVVEWIAPPDSRIAYADCRVNRGKNSS